ncbi:tetratricopeptide repeat-containing sensor histidine kinase [Phnomibacter sp.]|uniref:tetratricopeptide repeat-containing sensor histidine kinase n=1 Tax=Phnomibacter sp. TaxID=2836217 RepID=UPI002FDD62E8
MSAVHGQTLMNLDSLLRLLPATKADSSKVDLYINIGQQYEGTQLETAAHYYRLAGELSHQLGYTRGVIKYINNYTYILNLVSKYDSSLLLNQQAIRLSDTINDSLMMGKAFFNAGTSARLCEKLRLAVQYYLEGQRIFERHGNASIEARGHDILQSLYENLDQFDKAKEHGRIAVSLSRAQNDSLLLMSALANLGMSYAELNQLDSAEKVYNESLAICRLLKNDYSENILMLNMGDLYFNQQKFQQLKPMYARALAISTAMENIENTGIALRGMAIAHLYENDYATALRYAQRALQIADSLHVLSEKQKCLNTLANIHFALHNVATAASLTKQASMLADSISNQRLQRDVAELETIYLVQQKEDRLAQQQASLRQKSNLNYALGALAILLLASLLLIWRTWQQKQKLQAQEIDRLQQEKQLVAAEAIMQGEEQERSRLAKDLHDGLGGMLSGIKFSLQHTKGNVLLNDEGQAAFEKSIVMLDQSINEMRRVAHNMMPESLLKFGLSKALTDFCHDMQQSSQLSISCHLLEVEKLPKGEAISVYRIVQELVNNILKHAHATEALIQVTRHDNVLSITVEDNGRGMQQQQNEDAAGMGWNNIRSRVHFLKGQIDVQSTPEAGTSVHIEWPVQG